MSIRVIQAIGSPPKKRMWYGKDDRGRILRLGNLEVGRNSPCPCGSGKKYKKCCGRS